MTFCNFWENEILDHVFGKGAYTPPTIFVALSTADPTDTALAIAEPFGGSYARVETAGADWAAASGGALSNGNEVTFPEASGDWGTISHFCLFDQARTSHAITGVVTGTKTFTVAGDQTLELVAGTLLSVDNSTGNDGNYTVTSSTFDVDHTDIVTTEAIADATVDGTLYPMGNPLGYGALSVSKAIASGDTGKFAAGDLDVTLD